MCPIFRYCRQAGPIKEVQNYCTQVVMVVTRATLYASGYSRENSNFVHKQVVLVDETIS